MLHRLVRSQLVRRPRPEVFAFFADPENLEAITPDDLRFQIVTPRPIAMRAGATIEYRLRLLGIGFGWLTRIEEFEPEERFVDVQVKGPYRTWRHTHAFREVPEGTLVLDSVEYELPAGLVGDAVHALFVRRRVAHIFDHRMKRIDALLPPA